MVNKNKFKNYIIIHELIFNAARFFFFLVLFSSSKQLFAQNLPELTPLGQAMQGPRDPASPKKKKADPKQTLKVNGKKKRHLASSQHYELLSIDASYGILFSSNPSLAAGSSLQYLTTQVQFGLQWSPFRPTPFWLGLRGTFLGANLNLVASDSSKNNATLDLDAFPLSADFGYTFQHVLAELDFFMAFAVGYSVSSCATIILSGGEQSTRSFSGLFLEPRLGFAFHLMHDLKLSLGASYVMHKGTLEGGSNNLADEFFSSGSVLSFGGPMVSIGLAYLFF